MCLKLANYQIVLSNICKLKVVQLSYNALNGHNVEYLKEIFLETMQAMG